MGECYRLVLGETKGVGEFPTLKDQSHALSLSAFGVPAPAAQHP